MLLFEVSYDPETYFFKILSSRKIDFKDIVTDLGKKPSVPTEHP